MTRAMPMIAVLLTPPVETTGSPEVIPVGGLSSFERQRRLVRAAGATRIVVVGASPVTVRDATDTVVIADAVGLARLVDDAPVLLVAAGLVLDARIVAAVASAPAPSIATWPASGPLARAGVERIDAASVSAGIGLYPGAMVRAVAAELGDWDLSATLLRTALTAGASRIDLSSLGAGSLVWARDGDADVARITTEALMATARHDRPGWPARVAYPPLEAAAVRQLLPYPVPASAIRLTMFGLAVLAAVAFATGWMWTGLVLALVCGPIDGIAGLLARVRLEPKRWAVLDSRADAMIDLAWSGAIVAGFAARDGGLAPWAVGTVLIGFGVAERLQRRFFARVTGGTLDDAGRFERRFALVAARRDVLLWAWLPFAVVGQWRVGLAVLAAGAMTSFFVTQWRVMVRLVRGTPLT